jgi:hypothetical protein
MLGALPAFHHPLQNVQQLFRFPARTYETNSNTVHNYFFPAIKTTHPEAVKVTLADEVSFGLQRRHSEVQTWNPPAPQLKRGAARNVIVMLLLITAGAVVWLIRGVQAPWNATPNIETTQQSQKTKPAATDPQKSLTGMRAWTDSNGRILQAKLISISKGSDGLYVGRFRRPNDEEFTYHIGLLSRQDIELVKTLTQDLKR